MNNALKNAKAVRQYVEYLRDAKRRSESTIRTVERSIRLFEVAANEADFASFDRRKAKRFTTWLEDQGKSARQSYQILHHVRAFLHWLAFQPGYKSRVHISDIEYLSQDRKRIQEVTSPDIVEWPSKEYVIELAKSIEPETEIDKRDRALISFLLLSGMRDMAVVTLPIGCFDPEKLEVCQFPDRGVETKFSKRFVSRLFVFDDRLLKYVLNWVRFLTEIKMFSAGKPLFPRTRVIRDENTSEFCATEVEPVFWKSAGPIRGILKSRSESAGLSYYKPHAFRHATSQLALRQCMTPEEIRAVSQNLGHENVGTTLTSYAKLPHNRIHNVLSSIDFVGSKTDQFDDDFWRKMDMLRNMRNRKLDNQDI